MGDMVWVGHWLDTLVLSPEPHPQTASMLECLMWSKGKWVWCTKERVGVASSYKRRGSMASEVEGEWVWLEESGCGHWRHYCSHSWSAGVLALEGLSCACGIM